MDSDNLPSFAYYDATYLVPVLSYYDTAAAEIYTDIVTIFNTRLGSIPDKFVGEWMKLGAADLFKVAESDRQDVEISFRMTA